MQAITYRRYGSPDVLEYRQTEKPTPAPSEVLIQVRAASVNPYDWHFLRGTPFFIRLFTGLRKPRSPALGADVAGIVAAVGPEITRFKIGDAVFGVCKGAFAEFACAKETALALKPESLSFEEAASVPIAGITALQGLRDRGRVQPGQRVLINGAAGGVGTFAVQIGKYLGAQITGVCSAGNVALVKSLGADAVIDYTLQDFTRSPERYDVIFDLVGNHPLKAIRRALRSKGIFVGCGGGGPDKPSSELMAMMLGQFVISPFTSQKLTGVFAKINTADLNTLGDLLQSGRVKPVLDRSYPLGDTSEALRYVERCHARGKVIIAVNSDTSA
ncbi:MAG: NAD(P)-dependent alcohol dehydrogenase [Acidobacteriaceae bacterium]|nr:NAD(P)-dependent alcohol dehydrogenase [Acidobacteriaceae bacterium]MBV9297222.1 NAD(P)-dependent alcohol dehydrogenase [Acidobacteriaceae bacterium]MBV9764872.1 NAD(P)-dependent alcohol dehydrogenase [Acidobacteriaceae bacterium]